MLSCTEPTLGRRTSLPTFPVIVKEDSVIGMDDELRFSICLLIFLPDLKHWEFNVFRYSEKDLLPLIKNM